MWISIMVCLFVIAGFAGYCIIKYAVPYMSSYITMFPQLKYAKMSQYTYKMGLYDHIVVRLTNGSVIIKTHAEKEVYIHETISSKRQFHQFSSKISYMHQELSIHAQTSSNDYRADYIIFVPHDVEFTRTTLDVENGRVVVQDIKSDCVITLRHGQIQTERVRGVCVVSCNAGTVMMYLDLESQDVDCRINAGTCTIKTWYPCVFNYQAQISTGSIDSSYQDAHYGQNMERVNIVGAQLNVKKTDAQGTVKCHIDVGTLIIQEIFE